MGQLLVNGFEAVEHLAELPLADLKHYLLILLDASLCLVLLQIHLHVQGWHLDTVLLFRRDLYIHPPVEIAKLWKRGKLILQIHFRWFSNFAHHFEQECLDLLWKVFWELLSNLVLVVHADSYVLFEESVKREN